MVCSMAYFFNLNYSIFFLMILPPPRSTFFPYTTLFRSAGRSGTWGTTNDQIVPVPAAGSQRDRKSTRLNSSHRTISYAVFCLKKKKEKTRIRKESRHKDATSTQRPLVKNETIDFET